MHLLVQAKPILNGGKVSQLLDSRLGDSYDRDQMERMVLAATLCVKRAPRARPQMSLVRPFCTILVPILSGYHDMPSYLSPLLMHYLNYNLISSEVSVIVKHERFTCCISRCFVHENNKDHGFFLV